MELGGLARVTCTLDANVAPGSKGKEFEAFYLDHNVHFVISKTPFVVDKQTPTGMYHTTVS